MDANEQISISEVKAVCNAKMLWWEKMIYSPDWIVSQFEADCGFPLTTDSLKKKSCFQNCFYREGIVNKLCA